MGKVILKGELAIRADAKEIEVETKGRRVVDILKDIADRYNLWDFIFKNKTKVRPYLLIMIDGRDYLSLGKLNEVLEDEKEIKIIPTFHGG
ncbi:MAG: MoaD/ThiS family protein [Candidatus Njordarchaeales archaeon]